MPRIRILPYKQGSKSAKTLANALGGLVLKLEGSKYVQKVSDVIINWGNTNVPRNLTVNYNHNIDNYLNRITNKLNFFRTVFENERRRGFIPEFWTNREEIPNEVYPIVCRTVLAGHSGAGIVIANDENELVDAPLYTRYIKKQDEYRIHIGRTKDDTYQVISIQKKAKRNDTENPNWQVRNHQNGFVYIRNDINPPDCVINVAMEIFDCFQYLKFGAIDVIYNAKKDRAYVLEINTAPGLEGQTVEDYANFFRNDINN